MTNKFQWLMANLFERCKAQILVRDWFQVENIGKPYWKSLRTLKFKNVECMRRFLTELSSIPNTKVTIPFLTNEGSDKEYSIEQMVALYTRRIPEDRNELQILVQDRTNQNKQSDLIFTMNTGHGVKAGTRTVSTGDYCEQLMGLCKSYCRPVSRLHPWADAVVVDTDSEREHYERRSSAKSANVKSWIAIGISVIAVLVQVFTHF